METHTLIATLVRITYHEPEQGFYIFKAQHQKRLITVKGQAMQLAPGCQVSLSGEWQTHPTYGKQFHAETIENLGPASTEGLLRYLCSDQVPGIGEKSAKLLVAHFKEETWSVIREHPERLKEVKGLEPRRIKAIEKALAEKRREHDTLLFLYSHGIGPARARRLMRRYGDQTMNAIRDNPYRLVHDLHGFAFRLADQLAMQLGLSPDSMERQQAAIEDVLSHLKQSGHCYLDETSILEEASKRIQRPLLDGTDLLTALADDHIIYRDTPERCYPYALYQLEMACQQHLLTLLDTSSKALALALGENPLALSDHQRQALQILLSEPLVVLTGGPGVGKTTLIRYVLTSCEAANWKVALAAPTGKAAKRLSQSCEKRAVTLHRLLKFDAASKTFSHDASHPLKADLVIVDEVSMVDLPLFHALLMAITKGTRLILVGDPDQLPSIGPGQILTDLVASQVIPVAKLNEIFRQSGQSLIVENAHRINQGLFPKRFLANTYKDFDLIMLANGEDVLQLIAEKISTLSAHYNVDPIAGIQVLCPMKKGLCGTDKLNSHLQQCLNGQTTETCLHFKLHDKVMQTVNNYDKKVFNGDVGRVVAIDQEGLTVAYGTWQVVYASHELDELQLAYASTVHKSQGSEYPVVIIPMLSQHYLLLERQLLYTAVTRGKRHVVLISEPKALALALNRNRAKSRKTHLAMRLIEAAQTGSLHAN